MRMETPFIIVDRLAHLAVEVYLDAPIEDPP
jgi:hypothetical protein